MARHTRAESAATREALLHAAELATIHSPRIAQRAADHAARHLVGARAEHHAQPDFARALGGDRRGDRRPFGSPRLRNTRYVSFHWFWRNGR